MKELSEEWQMKIFDLLEGNLSDQEKSEVEKAMEADPALKREFELMSRTYLTPDEVVFEDKGLLYRKPGIIPIFTAHRWYAAAAAVTILIGAVMVLRFGQTAENKESMQANNSKRPDAAIPERREYQKSPGLTDTPGIALITIQQEKQVKKASAAPGTKRDSAASRQPSTQGFRMEQPMEIASLQGSGISAETPETVMPEETPVIVIVDQYTQPISYRKKKTLNYRLLNNSRQMLANLRLPEVNLRTSKGRNRYLPALKVEIRTPDTQVIATLIE